MSITDAMHYAKSLGLTFAGTYQHHPAAYLFLSPDNKVVAIRHGLDYRLILDRIAMS